MKISELLSAGSIDRAMQIPVAINGENRSLNIGQIIDALTQSILPFDSVLDPLPTYAIFATGAPNISLPVVFLPVEKKFYAMRKTLHIVSGLPAVQMTLYGNFNTKELYHDGTAPRQDCLYVANDGRLYYYNGSSLISAGLTDEQAALLRKLTPQKMESETDLENMQAAGLIVPGQVYYIPEAND